MSRFNSRSNSRPITALLLAGRIRPSPVVDAFGMHELCLPMGVNGRLLDAWLQQLARLPDVRHVRVIVNTFSEVSSINAAMSIDDAESFDFEFSVMADQSPWRGAAGIVRDAIEPLELESDSLVLICECKRLPPASLMPIVSRVLNDETVAGAVGFCGIDEPAGIYAFSSGLLKTIPTIGYFDFKEQFLPAVARVGQAVARVPLGDCAHRVADAESYLASVKHSLRGELGQAQSRISSGASISSSAIVNGSCIIEEGAVIEDGAVVHDSVVLWGATIGGGAVISRSIVGPLASVPPRSRVIKQMMPGTHGVQTLPRLEMNKGIELDTVAQNGAKNRLTGEVAKW